MRKVRKAFTLVEILIVVVILGILAAIVVPQFTGATEEAQGGNVQSQLDTLNNQLELYRARNNGAVPPLLVAGGGAAAWDDLVNGGYLKAAPQNPACPSAGDRTAVSAGGPAANEGWSIEDTNGDGIEDTIFANYFDEATAKVTPGVP